MEERVYDINDDKNEKNDEYIEAECLDDTPPYDIEEGVSDRNYNKNEKYYEENEEVETTDSGSTKIGEGKGVIDGIGGKDVDLYEFDASNCSGDRFYDIFYKDE